jgi:hypothetical protein
VLLERVKRMPGNHEGVLDFLLLCVGLEYSISAREW